LSAAFELSQKNQEVFVLEARGRVGGRVFTVRDFQDGQYAEGGGEYICDSHRTLLRYLKQFKIKTIDVTGASYLFKDNKISFFEDEFEDLNQKFDKVQRKPANRLYVRKPFKGRFARSVDKLTVRQFLSEEGFAESELSLLDLAFKSDYGISINEASLLMLLRDFNQPDSFVEEGLRIDGGNDLLANAFANELNNVFLNSKVIKIDYSDNTKVKVTYVNSDNGQNQEMLEGDFLVIAIPFTALSEVEFTPSLPEILNNMIRQLPYAPIIKVFSQFEDRFYEDDFDLDFEIITDLDNTVFWEPTGAQPGNKGILTAYTPGSGGIKVSDLSDSEKISDSTSKLDKIFPGLTKNIVQTKVEDWIKDPFVKGAYAYFPPEYLTTYGKFLLKRFGRIFFAGEHTEMLFGQLMNGALISGQRAAKKVLKMVNKL